MVEELLAWARKMGYEIAWGPAAVAGVAAEEVATRRNDGELDERLWKDDIEPVVRAGRGAGTGTVVMVAVPRPAHLVRFELGDGAMEAVLPPTYVRYRPTFEEVRQELARDGLPGARVEHLTAPLKATAARLGLLRYGRNNVGYTAGSGSYVQLCAYLTDAPLPVDDRVVPHAPMMLDECERCNACTGVCPTGAITDDRVLLRAHRCLTSVNESPGEWPSWVPTWAHTCLLGCLECQKVCPVNPSLTVEDTGVVFSAAETRSLLADTGAGAERDENGIRAKLAWLGQPYAEPTLGRNLRALAAAAGRGIGASATA